MRKAVLPSAALSLGSLLVAVPSVIAWADDPTWTQVADKSLTVIGGSSDAVKIASIVVGGGLIAWVIWLRFGRRADPEAASAPAPPAAANQSLACLPNGHTVEELFTLVNSLSDRMDGLTERFDRHLEQHVRAS